MLPKGELISWSDILEIFHDEIGSGNMTLEKRFVELVTSKCGGGEITPIDEHPDDGDSNYIWKNRWAK